MSLLIKGNNGHCQCLHEINNGLPRTKFCLIPCAAQKEMMQTKIVSDNKHISRQAEEIIKICKSIGWENLYPETIKRLEFFVDRFKEYYHNNEITEEELIKTVVFTFGRWGQGEVYNIYMQVINEEDFKSTFGAFVEAFKVLSEETVQTLKPRHYIDLFIEYLFSIHIKR